MMIAAVYNKDWEYVSKLADRFYNESNTLASLVDGKLRR